MAVESGEGFDQFYGENYPKIKKYLSNKFGASPEDVEDVAQDTLVKIALSENPTPPSSLVFEIAYHRMIDIIRHERLRRPREVLVVAKDAEAARGYTEDFSSDVTDQLGDTLPDVMAAMSRLPLRQSLAFRMAHVDELPYADIADRLEIKVNAVKALIHRAGANLRRGLTPINTL